MTLQAGDQAPLGEGRGRELGAHRAQLGAGVRGQLFDLVQLSPQPLRLAAEQQHGRVGGECHAEERLTHRVVQVARQPLPLARSRQALRPPGRIGEPPVGLPKVGRQRIATHPRFGGAPGRQRIRAQEEVDGGVDGGEDGGLDRSVLPDHRERDQRGEQGDEHDGPPQSPALHGLHARDRQQDGEVVTAVGLPEKDGNDDGLQHHVRDEVPRPPPAEGRFGDQEDQPDGEQDEHQAELAAIEGQKRAKDRRRVEEGGGHREDPALGGSRVLAGGAWHCASSPSRRSPGLLSPHASYRQTSYWSHAAGGLRDRPAGHGMDLRPQRRHAGQELVRQRVGRPLAGHHRLRRHGDGGDPGRCPRAGTARRPSESGGERERNRQVCDLPAATTLPVAPASPGVYPVAQSECRVEEPR